MNAYSKGLPKLTEEVNKITDKFTFKRFHKFPHVFEQIAQGEIVY